MQRGDPYPWKISTTISHAGLKQFQWNWTGRYLADGYRYTYYQLRSRYKNWFTQVYLNQGNSGETRGYDLGNVVTDESRNMAFQLQNNFDIKNTNIVWGFDYFRTEAKTNGSILNDGPNGYDNDGDAWYTNKDDIDNDYDSDDFYDWGIDGIGPYLTNSDGELVLAGCNDCDPIVSQSASGALYNAQYDFWYIDDDQNGAWTNGNPCYPYICNEQYPGADLGEGNGIPDPGEPGVNINGNIVVDGIDNDCDGCDYDNDGSPNFQEIHYNTNIVLINHLKYHVQTGFYFA